jgi:hypothetical protein
VRRAGMHRLCARTHGSPDAIIALIDGTPSREHPALARSQLQIVDAGADCPTSAGDEAAAHATFLASMFAGSREECLGLCPCSGLLCLAAVDGSLLRSSAMPRLVAQRIAQAMAAAVEAGAQIIQLSLELGFGDLPAASPLVNAFRLCQSKGVIVVLAAGQALLRRPNLFLGRPGVIPVVASDEAGNTLHDERWGASVVLAGLSAPGTRIPGARMPSGVCLRTGSSFACSFVTAAIALLMASRPGMTAAEAGACLCVPRNGALRCGRPQPLDVDQTLNQPNLN